MSCSRRSTRHSDATANVMQIRWYTLCILFFWWTLSLPFPSLKTLLDHFPNHNHLLVQEAFGDAPVIPNQDKLLFPINLRNVQNRWVLGQHVQILPALLQASNSK